MLKVGDKLWYAIPKSGLAVLCTITKVADDLHRLNPKSTIFYFIDEPTDHLVGGDRLFDTPREVERELLKQGDVCITLEEFRAKSPFKELPQKERLTEWFNLEDVYKNRGRK